MLLYVERLVFIHHLIFKTTLGGIILIEIRGSQLRERNLFKVRYVS